MRRRVYSEQSNSPGIIIESAVCTLISWFFLSHSNNEIEGTLGSRGRITNQNAFLRQFADYWEKNRKMINDMEPTWQKDLGRKVVGFRSKLETQRIQLDFDDLRLKHLIEVSETVRIYTTEYGYPLEDVAEVIGVPLSLARRLHSFLNDMDAVPATSSDRTKFLKVFGVEKMRRLSTEYEEL